MIEFARRPRHARDPDLTPLVDIVFKLVLFFMLTSTFIASESMELNLPGKSAPSTPVATDALRIQIASTGHVMVDGAGVNKEQLEDVLTARIDAAPDVKIGIFTTPGVSVQQLVSIMDMVYMHGGRNVQVDRMQYPADAPQGVQG